MFTLLKLFVYFFILNNIKALLFTSETMEKFLIILNLKAMQHFKKNGFTLDNVTNNFFVQNTFL